MERAAILCFLVTLVPVYTFTLPFEGLYTLDIIHYNDFHARYEETSVESPTCRFNNNSCLGGFPRLYHEIQVLLKEKPDALLLNAGDSFQGTYWYTLLKWNITQQFMNLLPHDAHALGNHEFDDGPDNLAKYISHLKAPVLAANMDSSQEPVLQGLYKGHTIVKRKGRKIGIIGLITTDTKFLSTPRNVTFTDPGEALDREAKMLTEKGVDIIVLLSHCGLDVDKELARDHGEYIDIIVGGHTHSLLWNDKTSPTNEIIVDPYPVFVENSADNKHKVLIVQASAFTKYMGNLSIDFDYKGDFVKYTGGPLVLDRSIVEDSEIKAKLAPYAEIVHEAENVPVGKTLTTLHYADCVFGECTLGDLICDAMNDFAKSSVKSEYPYLAFIQRGTLKSSIVEGDITQGEIFEVFPYNDRILTFEMQGKDVLSALERGVSDAWAYDPFKGPWVLQVSGLRVTYNVSQPEGRRITEISIDDKLPKPFKSDAYYQVTVPTYLSDGGDGFTMFKERRNEKVIGRDIKCIEDYIKAHSPLDVKTQGRITINS